MVNGPHTSHHMNYRETALTKTMRNVSECLHASFYFSAHIFYGSFYQKAFHTLPNLTVDGCRPCGSERLSIGINDVARVN
jgi:hypothetical protein